MNIRILSALAAIKKEAQMKTLIGIATIAAALAAQATVYRAGLKGGYVNEWKSDNYHSRVIDAIGVFNGPVAGTNGACGFIPPGRRTQ